MFYMKEKISDTAEITEVYCDQCGKEVRNGQ